MTSESFAAIIITADEPFGIMSHTQILYAQFLAKTQRVIYVMPPKAWTLKNLFGIGFESNRIEQGVEVIAYRNFLPQAIDRFFAWNEKATEKIIANCISTSPTNNLLIWHFDSYRSALNTGLLKKRFNLQRIYHVIDPFYKNPIDRLLCQLCDLLIVTSPRNTPYYSNFQSKLITVPQALDLSAIQQHLSATNSLHDLPSYFVLLGTLSDDLDFDWLKRLTDRLPAPLIMIGKKLPLTDEASFSTLCGSSKCQYLGLMPPEKFYPILQKAAAGLITYNDERRSKVCSPLKAFNYLMAGIPVISNIDTEISDLQGSWVHETQDYAAFEEFCFKAFQKQLELNDDARRNFLEAQSIALRVQQILEKLQERIA